MANQSFARKVASSVLYSGIGNITSRLVNAGALLYTLKVITESDLGIANLAIGFFASFKALTQLGLGAALVQEKRISRLQIDSLFWVSFILSLFIYMIVFFAAPYIAWFYEAPTLSPLIRVFGLGIIAFSLYMIPRKMMIKDLDFKRLAIGDNLALTASAGLMIYMAYNGLGAWAIVLAEFSNKIGQMLFCQFFRPYLPRLQFDYQKVKHLINFGMFTTGSRFFQQFFMNVDYMIIGAFFSKEVLGIYSFAYRLIFDPVKELVTVVNRVAYPAFSELQDDVGRLKNYFFTITRGSMLMVGVVLMIIGAYIDWFLPLIGYDKWLPAVPYIRLFAVAGILQSLITILPRLLNAHGQARPNFYFTGLTAATLTLSFLITAQFSVTAVSLTWLTVYPLVSVVLFFYAAKIVELPMLTFIYKSLSAFSMLIPLTAFTILMRVAISYALPTEYHILGIGAAVLLSLGVSALLIWYREKEVINAIRG